MIAMPVITLGVELLNWPMPMKAQPIMMPMIVANAWATSIRIPRAREGCRKDCRPSFVAAGGGE